MVNGAIINAASFDCRGMILQWRNTKLHMKSIERIEQSFSVEKQPMIVLKIRQNNISRKLTMS